MVFVFWFRKASCFHAFSSEKYFLLLTVMKKLSKILVFAMLFITSINTSAAESSTGVSNKKDKKFNIVLSADNTMRYSQDASTNLMLSLVNGLAYTNDKYELNDNLLIRLANLYVAMYITTINHEVSGHGQRVHELDGYWLKGYNWHLDGSASTSYYMQLPYRLQKGAVIAVAGVQADYFLSQKIINQALNNEQEMDPISSAAYMFSAADQVLYSYSKYAGKGHDILRYVEDMQGVYGAGAITEKKIKSVAFLDLLDPLLYTSIYSAFANEDMKLPMLPLGELPVLGNIGVMPAAKLVLTPYGVLEKRLVVYAKTDYTPMKFVFGFGRENKTNVPFQSEYIRPPKDLFITPDAVMPKRNNTYYLELAVNKVVSFKEVDLGFLAAGWRQPKLFLDDPRHAKIKNGGMFTLRANHRVNKDWLLFADLGYKTQGFVVGQPLDRTSMLRFGFEWTL
jgi:hypothetical protein